MQFSPKDTLFLHADTLKSIPDLPAKELIKKTGKQPPSPAKVVTALATVADSLKAKGDEIKKVLAIVKDSLASTKDTTLLEVLTQTGQALSNLDSLALLKDTTNQTGKILSDILASNLSAKDSIQNSADTLKSGANNKEKDDKIFMAYHHVRFYKKDLQGICDSLAYLMKDSVMRLFSDPVLWSEVHQLSAEKIEYRPHNPGPDIARLENNGFIISREDSIKYNQISGKTLLGFIYNNKLKRIEVNGNAVTLYYLKNKERFSGMNKLESSKINVYLVESKIDSIAFFPKPEGKTIPLKDLTPEEATLKGFTWRESEKPKNRFDIFSLDEKRKKIAGPEKKPASKK